MILIYTCNNRTNDDSSDSDRVELPLLGLGDRVLRLLHPLRVQALGLGTQPRHETRNWLRGSCERSMQYNPVLYWDAAFWGIEGIFRFSKIDADADAAQLFSCAPDVKFEVASLRQRLARRREDNGNSNYDTATTTITTTTTTTTSNHNKNNTNNNNNNNDNDKTNHANNDHN